MNHKVTLAVSAALMSMSVHSATELAEINSQFVMDEQQFVAQTPVSVNKNKASLSKKGTKFIKEPNLPNQEYFYFIQLDAPSVVSYDGGIEGFDATNPSLNKRTSLTESSPAGNQRLNVDSPAVKAYSGYIESKQNSFLSEAASIVSNAKPVLTFKYALNGMTMRLTPSEAEALSKLEGVKRIERDIPVKMDTDVGPGLIGAPEVWSGAAPDSGVGTYGEGVIVGILDSGINTDHPSFADVADDGYDHTNPWGEGVYLGNCAGDFPELCNDKLIGVVSYPFITDDYADTTVFPPGLPATGQDYDGHGSHVASTAAGNILRDVPELTPEFGSEQGDGVPTGFVFDQISGVAPRANIIAYQVCKPGDSGDPYSGCWGGPIVASIESAIEVGVDVINYSISGGGWPWAGATNEAWLNARNAGVFIALSAGNDGPGPSTTSKHAPWYTAVAATEHGRSIAYDKTIGDFSGGDSELQDLTGSSNSGGITASIVFAGDYENPNDPDNDPEQCLQPFPEGTFNGEIVVCDRGAIARVQKAINVADGGAGGFVLANLQDGASSVANDAYVVPGIHIDADQGDLLRAWLASGEGHTATISSADGELVIDDARVDVTAGFSSRGPNASISTLTPTITGPGVSIYAANADEQYGKVTNGPAPTDFAYLSGTSMSSPHIAGSAALVRAVHPTWTPDNVRSALAMTSIPNVMKEDAVTSADWFDMGSGRVQVDLAVQSGLVMDETDANYAAANPDLGGDPRTLNMPSITDDNCVGVCSWTRTVTATKAGTWAAGGASISGDLGITVSPAEFTLAAGESQELTVSIDAFNAPSDVWSFGLVSLTSEVSPDLHLPVSVVASNGNLPDSFALSAKRNQDSFLVKDLLAVEITDFAATSYGLTKATVVDGEVAQDSDNSSILDDLTDGLSITTVDVPEDAKRLVAMTSNSTAPDLDLFVVIDRNADGVPTADEVVGSSTTATADELVDLELPEAGFYWLIVQNWSASAEDATDTFELAYAVVDGEEGDNLTVSDPGAVAQLTPFDLRMSWDLADGAEGDMYFGAVELGTSADNAGNLGLYSVNVMRADDDVSVVAPSLDRLNPGDTLTFSVAVDANFNSEDRDYSVNLTLPEGVTLVEGSTDATVDGNTLSWMLSQPSLLGAEPSYSVTSNASDAMCAIPFGDGSYIDLAGFNIGINPNIDGDSVTGNFGNRIQFLGEEYQGFTLTDDGFITLGGDVGATPWVNQLFPNADAPNAVIAPYWRDMSFDVANGRGVSVASTGGDGLVIIEYDDMLTFYGVPDVADFQIVVNNDAAPGTPNIVFAYDNVEHFNSAAIPTTIGFENATGTAGVNTHYVPFFGEDAAPIGDIGADAVSGAQICFWLQDVSDEPTLLSFDVTVDADNAGGPIQMMAMSEVYQAGTETAFPGTTTVASEVFSGVQVEGPPVPTIDGMLIADLEVVELTELDLPGAVTEPNGDEVDILWKQVSGPAAVIAGNGIAEAILVAPEVEEDSMVVLEMTATDSNGNSVTATANVMVKNNLPPEVIVSAPSSVVEGETITVSVATTDNEGDDVSVTINGVAGTSYTTTAPATNADTSVTFTVVASDGLNETTETVTVRVTNKKAGSMGWIALLLIPAIWLRRKKMH